MRFSLSEVSMKLKCSPHKKIYVACGQLNVTPNFSMIFYDQKGVSYSIVIWNIYWDNWTVYKMFYFFQGTVFYRACFERRTEVETVYTTEAIFTIRILWFSLTYESCKLKNASRLHLRKVINNISSTQAEHIIK